jgi:ABC-type branched-subunit amino acid transport system ATPase component
MKLELRNIEGGYRPGDKILQGISLEVENGDVVGIIGLNGSGKTSLGKAIMNTLPYRNGKVIFDGVDVSIKSTRQLSDLGMSMFVQGGGVFDSLSVRENLILMNKDKKQIVKVMDCFPMLSTKDMLRKKANQLSGGERHHLALAMCLLKNPGLLILDEPSAGLSPLNVDKMYDTLDFYRKREKITMILIEQNVAKAVEFCRVVEVVQTGRIVYASDKKDLKEIEKVIFNKSIKL